MIRPLPSALLCLIAAALPWSLAFGQLGGSRAGVQEAPAAAPDLSPLDRKTVESHIAVEGQVELRVQPTAIRVVMAVTEEAESAQACRTAVDETVRRLKAAWSEAGIDRQHIVEDFIAVLPRYRWELERQGNMDVGVEKKVGYRMQTNLHLQAAGESQAQQAFKLAFEQGVTDIIAFDYWNEDLDAVKVKARQQALQAALSKADLLLGTLFDERPPAINVQEHCTVRYPESLYHSFTASYEEEVTPPWRRDMPFIRAPRPRNTYYRGLVFDGDVQGRQLPMTPEISVIATVRIYYRSPAAKDGPVQK